MLLDNVQRIKVDDFKSEDREVAERIAVVYNYFAEQVVNAVNGNLTHENMNRRLLTVPVTIGTNGVPSTSTKFVSLTGLKGIGVLKATNQTSASTYPTSAPFVTFSTNGTGTYTIQHVTGLVSGNKYELLLELVF